MHLWRLSSSSSARIAHGLSEDREAKDGATFVSVVAMLLTLTLGGLSLFERQEFGTVKVGTLWGSVQETQLDDGINFPVNPFVTWTEYNVQTNVEEFTGRDAFECLSKDDKEFYLEANASWRMVPGSAWWVKQNLKNGDALIRGALRTGPRKATAAYDLMEINENSAKLEELAVKAANDAIRADIIAEYFPNNPEDAIIPYRISKFNFRKPQLPESIQEAITLKFAKQQEAEAMAFVIQKEEQEKRRKKIEAEGIKEFQETVTEGISDKLLYWKYIEAMRELAGSDNTTFVFAPDGRENPFQIMVPAK